MLRARLILMIGTAIASATLFATAAQAQAQRRDTAARDSNPPGIIAGLQVRTFSLKHLDVKDAAKLIAPYLQLPGSGAFEAGSGLGVITIRGTLRELQQATELLAEFDRAPRTVRLRFQIIEPTQDSSQDPRIREVASALRELFAAPGYRLLGEGMVTTDESRRFDVTISAGQTPLHLTGVVQRTKNADSGIRLQVQLHQSSQDARNATTSPLFSGSLSAEFGRLVVLGSAVPLIFADANASAASAAPGSKREPYSQRTIILTVRPQLERTP